MSRRELESRANSAENPAAAQMPLFEPLWQRAKPLGLCHACDRIRERHGFTAIQRGATFKLQGTFPRERDGYLLKTSALSR